MTDFFSRIPKYIDLVAIGLKLTIFVAQSPLDIAYICDMYMEASHPYSKVEDSNVSCDKPDQPSGNIAFNGIVSMCDKLSILIVLEDV